MLGSIRCRLADIFDALDSPPVRSWLEHLVVTGAAVGFLVHLSAVSYTHLTLPTIYSV